MPTLPRFVALCGNPRAGKSEAQKILQEAYGYEPVDDGMPLREIAVEKFGLSWEDVTTQAGKLRYTEIAGNSRQNRDILGSLGVGLEEQFGEMILPFLATRKLDPAKRYSFGSVRKVQGHYYKQFDGVVLEIVNPDAGPSPYAFDVYDKSAIDARIFNNMLHHGFSPEVARKDLANKLQFALEALAAR
jgi:hypothetical protein